jgi:MoxR-like ATPase
MFEPLPLTDDQARRFAGTFDELVGTVGQVLVGKAEAIRTALTGLFAEGHLLLEDVPGTGKTSLAKALAQSIGGSYTRVQFTPDLLPADVTGSTIFNQGRGMFEFHPGPVFANIVLGDEINRASPKTQSALLEVMEEHQVTVDGHAYPVPRPFMVIATQNPIEFEGTYRLPEAQLDRFLMKMSIGYLDMQDEINVIVRRESKPATLGALLTQDQAAEMVALAKQVHVGTGVAAYVATLAMESRRAPEVRLGVSTRAGLGLIAASRVRAISTGRTFVTPDDVKALVRSVFAHRMVLTSDAEVRGGTTTAVVDRLLSEVPTPRKREE